MSQQLVPGTPAGDARPSRDVAFTITDAGVVLLRLPGELGMSQLMALAEGVQGHPAFERATTGIADLRRGRVQLTAEHIEACARWLLRQQGLGPARWAIVTHDPVTTALGYILRDRLQERLELDVFFLLESALSWLELSRPCEAVWNFLGEDLFLPQKA